MALLDSASDARFLFEITGLDFDLSLVSFTATEAISVTFSVKISVASEFDIPDIGSVVGKEALLTIINDTSGGITLDLDAADIDTSRYFHGMVRKFEYSGVSGSYYLYDVHLVPTFWTLSLKTNCRIFQDKNAQDIIKEVLEKGGITGDRVRFALTNKNRMRGFCVQYRETDFNFISRLMEEEGIFYFFEHYEDKHVVVFSDSSVVHVPIEGEPEICFRQGGSMVADQESVHAFTVSHRLKPGAYTARNFSFKNPVLDLTVEKKAQTNQHYEIYDYSGNYVDPKRGADFAKVRQEEFAAQAQRGHGASSSPRLIPGYTFFLTDHDCAGFNQEYLLVSLEHSGTQPQSLEEGAGGTASYHNQFTVIPYTVTYRSPQNTPKPFVTGVQTAIVVGPKGEEIHVDELGRIKVQFHWDRQGQGDDKSSCWIRAAQAWAGGGWGSVFTPRVGDEVLVDFIEGDPDRPIVVGSVYNGNNPTLYNPTGSKTVSGIRTKSYKADGFNELRFEDKAGSEQIYIHGQKDWVIDINNNKSQTIKGASHTQVTGKLTDKAKEIVLGADSRITLVCGGSSIVLEPGLVEISSPLVKINCGGSAVMPATLSAAINTLTSSPSARAKTSRPELGSAPAPAAASRLRAGAVNAPPSAAAPKGAPATGLGSDVDKLVKKSPTMSSKMKEFDANKGIIEYGPAGKGSYFSKLENKIVIDSQLQGNPLAVTQILSHELGHATSKIKTDVASKTTYVKSLLSGEGEATLTNLESRYEILKKSGTDIGVAGSNGTEYQKIYQDFLKNGDRNKAREAIGSIFSKGEKPSGTNMSYEQYYGDSYDNNYGSVMTKMKNFAKNLFN